MLHLNDALQITFNLRWIVKLLDMLLDLTKFWNGTISLLVTFRLLFEKTKVRCKKTLLFVEYFAKTLSQFAALVSV